MLYFPHWGGGFMNKILLILGLFFSIYSYGANAPSKSKTDDLEKSRDLCTGGAEIARTIMVARQKGVSLAEIYNALGLVDKETREMLEIFVVNAYDVPIADSPEDSKIISLEFANGFFKECMGISEGIYGSELRSTPDSINVHRIVINQE